VTISVISGTVLVAVSLSILRRTDSFLPVWITKVSQQLSTNTRHVGGAGVTWSTYGTLPPEGLGTATLAK
jgi:hypothetical protein